MNIPEVELIVLGAGPAGIEASLAAASAGARVTLIEQQPQAGGQYYHQIPGQASGTTSTEAKSLFERLQNKNIRLISGTTVWGIFPSEDNSGWQVEAHGANPQRLKTKSLILATGAYDYPLPFKGWTLPGVMTAGAAQILLKTQGILPGSRILVAGSGPLQFAAASSLANAAKDGKARVAGVLQAPFPLYKAIHGIPIFLGQAKRIREGMGYAFALARARIPVRWGWGIVEARGNEQVEEAVIARLDADWKPIPGSERILPVDAVIMGYGLLPNNHAGRMIGCRHVFDSSSGAWIPERDQTCQTSMPGVYIVGDAAEICGAESARLEGRLAGTMAAHRLGYLNAEDAERLTASLRPSLERQRCFGRFVREIFSPKVNSYLPQTNGEQIIACRCEDVTIAEVHQAVSNGAGSPAEVKMMTRCGMGNCQGRMCETTIIRTLFSVENPPIEKDALSIRPPLMPIYVSALTQENGRLPEL